MKLKTTISLISAALITIPTIHTNVDKTKSRRANRLFVQATTILAEQHITMNDSLFNLCVKNPNKIIAAYECGDLKTKTIQKITKMDIDKYMNTLSFRESSNNPQAVNSLGYVGLYQLGWAAFKDLGYSRKEYNHIKKTLPTDLSVYPVEQQKEDMIKYTVKVKKYMTISKKKWNSKDSKNYLDLYVGKTVNGHFLTEEGLMAAAHLIGHREVKKYLDSNGAKISHDAFGTSLEEYIDLFNTNTYAMK
jgi:hypothetical protein